MPDSPPPDRSAQGHQALIAELRREFCNGLPARLQRMHDALADLARESDPAAAERFYREVHSLAGTAAAYGADAVSNRAATLADRARGWLDATALPPDEVPPATADLRKLEDAIESYAPEVMDEDGR